MSQTKVTDSAEGLFLFFILYIFTNFIFVSCMPGTQVKLNVLYMVVILVVESELMLLVESTWNRVMGERRQALEEAYKIDLSAKPGSKEGQVSMGDVSPLWEETAMKAWQLFIGQSLLVCQHLRLLSAT